MGTTIDELKQTRSRLSEVSPSFCLAKWYQVTIHLQNGATQSCHHPDTHKVPLDELVADPAALHNTSLKKRLRQQMLAGEFPEECGYCWQIEQTSSDLFSDRHIKSNDSWAKPLLDATKNLPWNENVSPTYLEVSFSNLCNFKCSYCAPHISSSWMEEVRSFGPYLLTHQDPQHGNHYYEYHNLDAYKNVGKMPLPYNQPNPYLDAFWKWWPELHKKLQVFRITGGEPLLSRDTFRVLDYIEQHPSPELELCLNTNMGVPKRFIEKFISKLVQIEKRKNVKSTTIFTSVDTWGRQAEYIRHGLEFNQFWNNVSETVARLSNVKLVIMCTFNALSIPQFKRLLENVLKLKEKSALDGNTGESRIILDIAYLRHPQFLSVKVLTRDYAELVLDAINFMKLHQVSESTPAGFSEYEIEKLKRIHQWMLRPEDDSWLRQQRRNFFLFYTEHDRRRGTHFLAIFPELENFWTICSRDAAGLKLQV